MTALENAARQALEALESSRVFVTTREKIKHPEGTEAYDEIIEALRQALEQKQVPVQEPVAWISGKSLAEIKDFDATVYSRGGFDDAAPLYTKPPKREWVGLTDSERLEAAEIDGADEWFWKVCKALEAKLKEKNT